MPDKSAADRGCLADWEQLVARRRWFLCLVGAFLANWAFSILLALLIDERIIGPFVILGFLIFIPALVLQVQFFFQRCPACGKCFYLFADGFGYNFFAVYGPPYCIHCRAEPPPQQAASQPTSQIELLAFESIDQPTRSALAHFVASLPISRFDESPGANRRRDEANCIGNQDDVLNCLLRVLEAESARFPSEHPDQSKRSFVVMQSDADDCLRVQTRLTRDGALFGCNEKLVLRFSPTLYALWLERNPDSELSG